MSEFDSPEWTQDVDVSEMEGKYLTFWTDGQLYGVPIVDVVQIVGMQTITQVPDFPNYAKGIINLRGSIIPIIDVRLRLGKMEEEYDERTCIIVTNINEIYVGFIVDSIAEVTEIPENKIVAPPRLSTEYSDTILTGIGKVESSAILLIDSKKILSGDELERITSVADS